MSKAIEEFLEKLKNLEYNYEVYPYEKYDCEISLLDKYLYKREAATNEKILSMWKDIFHKPYFELHHPIYNHIKTRAVKAINMTNISQYLFFIDENNQYPWICVNIYNMGACIITPEKLYLRQIYMNDNPDGHNQWLRWKIIAGLKELELKKEDIIYTNKEFRLLIDEYARPWHYFDEVLSSIYKLSLFDCKYSIRKKAFFIPNNILKNNFFEENKDFIEIFPNFCSFREDFLNGFSEVFTESLEEFTTLVEPKDLEFKDDFSLTLWLGFAGERRAWLEQVEGTALILKNLLSYFPKIKVYIDGMTAYDRQRQDFPENKILYDKVIKATKEALKDTLVLDTQDLDLSQKEKIKEVKSLIVFKSLAGYDYRTKFCYCSMCDIAIGDCGTTTLTPFLICNKPGVIFYGNVDTHIHYAQIIAKKHKHRKAIDKNLSLVTNRTNLNFVWDYHIPPEHIYNLSAEVLEELKNIKMHRLDVPPVELYAKIYEAEKNTQIKLNKNESTKALLENIENQKLLLEVDNLILDKELKTLQIDEAKHSIELKTLQIKQLQIGYTKLVVRDDLPSAKARIHNHLSYKLGQIIIRNSKTLFDYIKLPYLLMAMSLIHKEQEKAYKEKIKANPKLALPALESYADYQEALKEKECLTYKLGLAFIKGFKSWYKGGLVKFYFEAKKLEREFKNKKAKQE